MLSLSPKRKRFTEARSPLWWTTGALVVASSIASAQEVAPNANEDTSPSESEVSSETQPEFAFKSDLEPLLKEYCINCHGEKRQKAELNLEVFLGSDEISLIESRKIWEKVSHALISREMPPDDKPQPTEDARMAAAEYIHWDLSQFDCSKAVNPGRVTVRRLNRNEYALTIRDLIGVDFNVTEGFPNDEVGYGFDNIGDVLSLPPMLMEKYLDAAEKISLEAIETDIPAYPPRKKAEAEKLETTADTADLDTRYLALMREGDALWDVEITAPGQYTFLAKAYGMQAGPDPARMSFAIDGEVIQIVDVWAVADQPEIYKVPVLITEPGKKRLTVGYTNNYNVQNHPDPDLNGDRNLLVDYLELVGPMDAPKPVVKASHLRVIPDGATVERSPESARKVMKRFASLTYRRPVKEGELGRIMELIEMVLEDGGSFEEAIQLGVQAVLVSPNFLYRWELDPNSQVVAASSETSESEPDSESDVRNVTDYELASRLSYFLWSSMPDQELFELADRGVLHEAFVLRQQIKRMLTDPKSDALVEFFAGQWLQIRNLAGVTPDSTEFPQFDEELRAAMKKETEMFFASIMREDRSVLNLLDADYTFMNERLAQHYGVEGVSGDEFIRVKWDAQSPRRGVLTQASILTITSNPTRTSPVNRGKWILEQILGAPPPPPPGNVEALAEGDDAKLSGSLRQRFELHRSKPECATCHTKMDPIGFAFENFDAVGRFRDNDNGFPIDPSGELPTGEKIDGPKSLINILKSEETFLKTLSEKMLTFALGRGLEYYDKCAVDDAIESLTMNDYRFSILIEQIVFSDAFMKRNPERQSSNEL